MTNLGGVLTVRVSGPGGHASVTVRLRGTNPRVGDILAYLAVRPDSAGFDKILEHESHMTHFTPQGEPKKSFDNGYGICQLTNPVPSYEQCWNWKLNIDGGLALFAAKQRTAVTYLSQARRTYTQEQLRYETVARWNGGAYHVWRDGQGWVRNPDVLCDVATGNIGWDMTDPANSGRSEADLHRRDAAKYRRAPGPNDDWGYFGVCYADRILG